MCGDGTEAGMQLFGGDVSSIFKLIDQPQNAMHVETLFESELPQAAIAGQERPPADRCKRECKSVGDRKRGV